MTLEAYQSHKIVKAAKIHSLHFSPPPGDLTVCIVRASPGGELLPVAVVPRAWYDKHSPAAGGYFVEYPDGYQSYSPAEAFESGYTKIGPTPVPIDEGGFDKLSAIAVDYLSRLAEGELSAGRTGCAMLASLPDGRKAQVRVQVLAEDHPEYDDCWEVYTQL